MIGLRQRAWGEPADGGPPRVELTLFSSEREGGQLAVGVAWEFHRYEGRLVAHLGPWQLSLDWRRPLPELWTWSAKALGQRCSAEGNWVLDRRRRAWYTTKVLVCILLGRDEEKAPPARSAWCFEDLIEVAWLAGGSYAPPGEPTTYWGDVLRVGRGVRRGWWYEIGYVST